MKVILDCNAYDLLCRSAKVLELVRLAISAGELVVLASEGLWQEVWQSPHRKMALSLPIEFVGESVLFCDGPCNSGLGAGILYRAHLGASKKHDDALIADSADYHADYLVSEDRRLRKRMNDFAVRCRAISFSEWNSIFLTADGSAARHPLAALKNKNPEMGTR
jgi:hypothetical protein